MKFLCLILAIALTLVGCKAKPVADVDQTRPLTGIASAVARADVRADTIIDLAKQIEQFKIADFATFITGQATGIKTDIKTVNTQLNAATDAAATAQDNLKEANYRIVKVQSDLDIERKQLIGDRGKFWLAVIIAAWYAIGIAGMIVSGLNPVGAAFVWGERLMDCVPFSNPLYFFRKLIWGR